MKKKYFTEEEKRIAHNEAQRRYSANNPNYLTEYQSKQANKAKILKNRYKYEDKNANRGECTLTEDFIMRFIFTKPCAHCGESDWRKIGCNRLDNSLPHTPDNVEPCCWECNKKMFHKEISKPVYQYTLDGELVKVWKSTAECGRNGFHNGHVGACCLGKEKTYKDYRWSYEPL